MRLSDLISGLDVEVSSDADVEVMGITADSRKVKQGFLFCAIAGADEDGARYIQDATGNGAVAIATDSAQSLCDAQDLVTLHTKTPRLLYAKLCAAFWPDQPKQIVAVTGTNGKTSVAEFYRQLWALAGAQSASIGTLGLTRTDGSQDPDWTSGNTSPAAEITHEALQRLAQHKVQHVAIEASSHGLDQCRLHGVKIRAAAFTNFTQDHLDYHGTMDAYFEAKKKLFTEFDAQAVVNADDEWGQRLLQQLPHAKSFGRAGEFVKLLKAAPTQSGLHVALQHNGARAELELPLYGDFQIENTMAAGALALLTGMEWPALLRHIAQLKGVRGRMEKVAIHPSGAPIFIDYAHTPDALKHLLISLRAHTEHKLHVVFGCGGDRDKTKRTPMGQVAQGHADEVIITDDNPRSEDPESIRQQIKQGAPDATQIADRERAIQQAITNLRAGDVLVVAGKGHETKQVVGDKVYEFNDAHKIKEALGAL
jgi:UDP-N-acetylmuramoyl-L-alanyl-D-glutamate--2,6-diaminopimelate ligase